MPIADELLDAVAPRSQADALLDEYVPDSDRLLKESLRGEQAAAARPGVGARVLGALGAGGDYFQLGFKKLNWALSAVPAVVADAAEGWSYDRNQPDAVSAEVPAEEQIGGLRNLKAWWKGASTSYQPTWQELEESPEVQDNFWASVGEKVSRAGSDLIPRLAVMRGLGMAKLGVAGGGAVAFGAGEEGFDPKGATVGAVIPGVQQVGKMAAGRILGRMGGGALPVAAQKGIEELAGLAAIQTFNEAMAAPEMVKLYREEPDQFWQQLAADTVVNAGFLGLSVPGWRAGAPSETQRYLAGRRVPDKVESRKQKAEIPMVPEPFAAVEEVAPPTARELEQQQARAERAAEQARPPESRKQKVESRNPEEPVAADQPIGQAPVGSAGAERRPEVTAEELIAQTEAEAQRQHEEHLAGLQQPVGDLATPIGGKAESADTKAESGKQKAEMPAEAKGPTAEEVLGEESRKQKAESRNTEAGLVDPMRDVFLGNLRAGSRTAAGVSDTSVSPGKPAAGLTGAALSERVAENNARLFEHVAGADRYNLENPRELEGFVLEASRIVNEGITGEVWRTWEGPEDFRYVPPSEIPERLSNYYRELAQRLGRREDPVATAAWHEQEFDTRIHPFADGVGRTRQAITAAILRRGGLGLPKYPDRKTYYGHAKDGAEQFEAFFRGLVPGAPAKAARPVDAFGMIVPRHELPEGHGLLEETREKMTLPDGGLREPWRQEQVSKMVDSGTRKENPILWLAGGGAAAGKSTLLKRLAGAGVIPRENVVYIDPDRIKRGEEAGDHWQSGIGGIPEYGELLRAGEDRASRIVHEESSELAKRALAGAIAGRRDIIYDATLANPRTIEPYVTAAKGAGYEVRLLGVTTDVPEAIRRASRRAVETGRWVDPAFIISSHRGFANGWNDAYLRWADEAHLFDTSGPTAVEIATKSGRNGVDILDAKAYVKFANRRQLNELARNYEEIESRAAVAVEDPADQPGGVVGSGAATAGVGASGGGAAGLQASASGRPSVERAIEGISDLLLKGKLDRRAAHDLVAEAYGGTLAGGKFTAKDLSDIIEMAVNRVLLTDRYSGGFESSSNVGAVVQHVQAIKRLLERLPTQTSRTGETDKMQQFSTVPTEAFVASWVANLKPGDVVLEPSAGVGGLAVFAKAVGARVVANELSARRADLLAQTGIADHVTRYNAEHLNALLRPALENGIIPRPTVVVMNPPFSNAAASDRKNTLVGAKHVEEALKLLPEGGRLVAVVGSGMALDKARFLGWWDKIEKQYNVRANVQVNGEEYRKYGTSFDNQLVVIDKTGPTADRGNIVGGRVERVEELIPLLERIRNERPSVAEVERASAEPGGAAAAGGGGAAGDAGADAAAGSGAPGEPGGGRGAGGGDREGAGGLGGTPGRGVAGDGGGSDGGLRGAGERGAGGGADIGQSARGKRVKPTAEEAAAAKAVGLSLEEFSAGKRHLEDAGVFSEYQPRKVRIRGAQPHPTPLVESTAMAAVDPVDPTYTPKLPRSMITEGKISATGLENIVYAGQAHQKLLPNGQRLGYFIGDGTGVGKGRQIVGIIMDNWNQGRRKALWVSKNIGLMDDARRDFGDMGFDVNKVIDFWKNGGKNLAGQKEGVAFVPYSSLRSNNPGLNVDGVLHPPTVKPGKGGEAAKVEKGRMHLLREWLGDDFDGVIVFDEAHMAGNAIDIKGKRGVKAASAQGRTVLDVQRMFPKARIVYSSATGATDVTNLSYADRLGIWGPGTPFTSKEQFFNEIKAGGLSAMEIVARDLKSMGRYLARTLSFEGVTHRALDHKLTAEQRGIYDELARAWQYVLRHRNETMAQTGAANDGRARSAANSAFYGAQQRFYNQLLTAMQMPTVLRDAKAELAKDRSVVMQVVNTDEAAQNRQIARKASEAAEGDNYLEDLDLSPKEILQQYIENSYPTTLYQAVTDANGNTRWEPVRDANNQPVADPEAVRRKQELQDRIGLLKAPESPISMVLNTFGVDNVAEITGRSQRVVQRENPKTGKVEPMLEKNRGKSHRKVETGEFNEGKRRVLVFSDAGGTGFSYHAGRKFKNQQRRVHYLVQAGWRADQAMQGFGRTHRSDQASAPEYVLPSTDIKGHQRFISTIARRLSELGALTGGERKSAGGEMFGETSNLENQYAEDGVEALFADLHGGRVEGFDFGDVSRKLGFTKTVVNERTGEIQEINTLLGEGGELNTDRIPPIQQFLNRVLSLEVVEQNRLFEAFIERMENRIENAKADGSYDPGTQTLKALAIRKVADEVVYKDPNSTAATRLVEVEHDHPQKIMAWEDVRSGMPVERFVLNNRSGRLYALKDGPTKTLENGNVVSTYRRYHPGGYDIVQRNEVYGERYTEVEAERAQGMWNDQVASLPKVRTERDTYVVGAFLPVWDRLKIASPKIWRITPDGGETILGAHVPPRSVAGVRARLGAGGGAKRSPENVYRGVLENGERIELANGWRLKRSRVMGENRIEVDGLQQKDVQEFESHIGGQMERINFTPRFFLPTEEGAGLESVGKLIAKSPPVVAGAEVEHGFSGNTTLIQGAAQDLGRIRGLVAPQTLGGSQGPARFAGNLLRELNSRMANELGRADVALAKFRREFDRTPVNTRRWKHDPTLPLPRNFAFIDAYESGNVAGLARGDQAAAAELHRINQADLARVQALGTGALTTFYTNYFPHIWENPKAAASVFGKILGKAPLEGPKSFLKQRTHKLFEEGLKAGLKPAHDNPVDLWLLKKREIERYILAHDFTSKMKAAGLMKFKYAFAKAPDGWRTVDDKAFTVYGPPTVTIKEAFDAGMREATLDLLKDLGVPHARLARIGGRERWGYERDTPGVPGSERIVTKFAGPDFVIWHELGHVLKNRYADLERVLTATDVQRAELAALATARTDAASRPGFKRAVQTVDEQLATVLQAYVHAPDLMGRLAPTVKAAFENFLAAHPELAKINDIRPGLRLGMGEAEMSHGGLLKLGDYVMPEAAARVVNNFLSPGLNQHFWYRSVRQISNLMNSVQLGLSAFHLGFTSLDAATSRLAVAIEDMVGGKIGQGLKTAASVPVSPLTNIRTGAKLRREVLQPGSHPELAVLARALEQAGGRVGSDAFWRTEFTRRLVRAWHEGGRQWATLPIRAPLAAWEQTMRPILEYIVPRQKLGVFADMASRELLRLGPDADEGATREALRKAWDSVDNRMGQVVYDNLFYNRMVKDVALLSFRAYGWQLGKYREGIGAGIDAARAAGRLAKGERPEFTHRMAYAAALPLMVGTLGGMIHYLLTGNQPEGEDYFMPQTGELDRNGNPVRLNLPSYIKDVISYSRHPVTSFGHSLHPMWSAMLDLLQNKDFYDVRIRNPEDPLWKQGGEVAEFAAKQFVPFSVSGGAKLREEGAPLWKQLAPYFGFTPVPLRITMDPAQELAAEIMASRFPSAPRTREQFDASKLIKEVVQQMREPGTMAEGSRQLGEALADQRLNPMAIHTIITKLRYTPFQFQVHMMPVEDAMRVWRIATPERRAEIDAMVRVRVAHSRSVRSDDRQKWMEELMAADRN